MEARIFVLECLTNLHIGSGEVNFNIIDNQVERDVVTDFPTMNSSSVKGALRAFFEEKQIIQTSINRIFGKEEDGTSQGQLKILSGNLLARPIQNTSKGKPYKMVTPETASKEFENLQQNLLMKTQKKVTDYQEVEVIDDHTFKEYDLPVLARNVLDDDGISKNLWYEEVVPHKSLFYFAVVSTTGDTGLLDEFELAVKEQIIQFGANASIGYGLCKVVEVLK